MLVFMALNHVEIGYAQDELVNLFMDIASGNKAYGNKDNFCFVRQSKKLSNMPKI